MKRFRCKRHTKNYRKERIEIENRDENDDENERAREEDMKI